MRQYIRHPSDIPIMYDLGEVAANTQDYLKNVSLGGLCFRSGRRIAQGTRILVKIPLTHPIFRTEGVVIWCRPDHDVYEVGVQFMDKDAEFRVRMVEQVCYIEHYKREVWEKEGRRISGEEAAVEWIQQYAREFPR